MYAVPPHHGYGYEGYEPPQRSDRSDFLYRLLATAVVQGIALGGGYCMLQRLLNGDKAGKTITLRGKRIALSGTEAALLECLTNYEDLTVGFEGVGGLDAAKETLSQAVVAPFQYPELFKAGGMRGPPKGVLLYGPPGTGKTLLAKAIAKSCGAAFLEVRIENLFGKWLGESEQAVASIFSLARKLSPCVVFVDELDSLLSTRSAMDTPAYSNAKTIFLRQWDGFATHDARHKIVVVGATNIPDVLDQAVLRRLSVKIEIPYPNMAERLDILKILLDDEDTSQLDLDTVAARTERYSGADLKELVQQACRTQALAAIRTAAVPPPPAVALPPPAPWYRRLLPGLLGADEADDHSATDDVCSAAPPLTTHQLLACMDVVKSGDAFSRHLSTQRGAKGAAASGSRGRGPSDQLPD